MEVAASRFARPTMPWYATTDVGFLGLWRVRSVPERPTAHTGQVRAGRRAGAVAAAVLVVGGLATASPVRADGPVLRRLERPAYKPPPPSRSPSPPPPHDPGGQVVDDDDRRRVNPGQPISRVAPGVDIDARAVARFGNCTATHVGRGVFLTAGHCIDPQRGLVGFRTSPCPFDLELQGLGPARCHVVTFGYRSGEDYALLELDEPERAAALPTIPVDYGFDWPRQGRRWVRLYGYSGGELRVNPACEARWDTKTGRVVHRCDTEGGDSGAALIDVMTGYVIGVHGGAIASGGNYGFSTTRLPWAESLCVSISATAPLEFTRGGPPASLRLSTSHLSQPHRRIWVRLEGRSPRAHTRVVVRAPGVDLPVDASWLRWSNGSSWTWSEVLSLDDARPGPWSIDVRFAATTAASTTKGAVHGHVWVCP